MFYLRRKAAPKRRGSASGGNRNFNSRFPFGQIDAAPD
jgi:hypothetical protein